MAVSALPDLNVLPADALLLTQHLEKQGVFFGHVETVLKPTAAILPVFFGKKDACMVDEASFDLMKELNPQVGQQLQVVAMSEPFANPVVYLREDGWRSSTEKEEALQGLRDLNRNPAGQQICTLFGIDGLNPFDDAQLESIRKLQETYRSLRKQGRSRSHPEQAPEKSNAGEVVPLLSKEER